MKQNITQRITPGEIINFALNCPNYEDIAKVLEYSMRSEDKWVVNSCVVGIEYLARDFGKYPQNVKNYLWSRKADFQGFEDLFGSIENANEEILLSDAQGV